MMQSPIAEPAVSGEKQKELDAIKSCSQKFPDLPEDLRSPETLNRKMLTATKENVPSARCFMKCIAQTMFQDFFDENGDIIAEKLKNYPNNPTEEVLKNIFVS